MKKIILAAMALAGLCACSSDDALLSSSDIATTTEKDAVYFKFDLSFADVTRSETNTDAGSEYGTSTSGEELGQTSENQVNSLTVALVSSTGETITEYVKDPELIGTDTYVVTFEKKDVTSFAGQNVNVYIYCNHEVEEFDENEVYNTEEVAPWTENAFYMSNAISHSETLPSTIDMNSHNTIANPIDLGVVKVERSVARFDYKDGADDPINAAYTYPIWYDSEGGLLANLVLSEVALINMSSQFYAFRHMAETDGASQEGSEYADLNESSILTTEMPNNWVIDTDASDKINYAGTGLTSNFTYPLETPSTWKWDTLTELTDEDDNGTYHIWRYATENTIPSVEAQKNGISTGVVFKAELVNTSSDPDYIFGGDGTGRVYVYENNLYESWDAVAEAAAVENENYSLHDAYREVMDVWTDPAQTEYDSDVTAAMAKAGFTGYAPEDGKYYVYYYYWNQHNNNGIDGTMGIMEYAVVRNNVYKLSVTDITGFGHPTPSDNPSDPDPDPINPDDPDETQDIYLKVDVEILPWVVRENNIKF
ncbi:MAG: Mfa1 family fimbria major subunit [Prevotella sp.]|nr:Mfa1 family fimbria major subunit [Prevotella sp.]